MRRKPSLASVWAKIGRADQHLRAVEYLVNGFVGGQPYGLQTKAYHHETEDRRFSRHDLEARARERGYAVGATPVVNEDGTINHRLHLWDAVDVSLTSVGTLDATQVALLAGDVAHNLRSALDHVVWSLAETYRRTCGIAKTPLPKFTESTVQFPIYCDEFRFLKTKSGGTKKVRNWDGAITGERAPLAGVDPKLWAHFEALQPYRRRKKHPELDWLWLLHQLDIHDKHRAVQIVASVVKPYDFAAAVPTGVTPNTLPSTQRMWTEPIRKWRSRPFKDAAVVARVRVHFDPPVFVVPYLLTPVEVGCRLSIDVAFGQGPPLHRRRVIPFLVETRNHVVKVIEAFAPYVR